MSGGLRMDFFDRYTPEVTLGPTALQPNRNLTFPAQQVVRYKDLSPRIGMAYDVFGNSKTAFKVSLNRYVQDLSLLANNQGSAQQNYQATAARSWTDSNGNFYPDCDLTNPASQNLAAAGSDICGAFTGVNANFGLSVPTSVDDSDVDGFGGWNHRGSNWEFSTSLQQEIMPRRMAVDFGYFRRWYGNFTVTDNFATSVTDYSPFDVVVPIDSRLPLSGQTITFLDLNPDKASLPSDNHVRFSKNYGDQYERWHGVDLSTSVRIESRLLLQGGLSTGKQVTDNCSVLAQVPEGATNGVSLTGATANIAGPLAVPYCHQEQPWLMQVKGLASYTIPRVDVQMSGTFQSIPGPQIGGTLVVPNAQVQSSLGRSLSGGASNVTVTIVKPGSVYGDRLKQVDLRVGKIFQFGDRRITTSVDLYNVLNGNAVLQQNNTFSTTSSVYGTPQLVQQARLLKFTLAMSF